MRQETINGQVTLFAWQRFLDRNPMLGWVLLLWLLLGIAPAAAQEPTANVQFQELSDSLTKNLESERAALSELDGIRQEIEQLSKGLDSELSTYKLQLSTTNNLLLLPTAEVQELEKARANHSLAQDNIALRVNQLETRQDTVQKALTAINEQITLNSKQLADMQAQKTQDPLIATIARQLQDLLKLLKNRRAKLERMNQGLAQPVEQWRLIQENFQSINERFDTRISERKKEELFQREAGLLTLLGWDRMVQSFTQLKQLVTLFFSPGFWNEQIQSVWRLSGVQLLAGLLLFVIVEGFFLRGRSLCSALTGRPFFRAHPWQSLSLEMLTQSMGVLGATLFLYGYAEIQQIYGTVALARITVLTLATWLFTGWGLSFLRLWGQTTLGPPLPKPLDDRLRLLLILVRGFTIGYMLVAELLGPTNVLLILARALAEIGLLVWSVSFWRRLPRTLRAAAEESGVVPRRRWLPVLTAWGYTVAVGGLLAELAGYGSFAFYWYAGWGRTLVVMLWATLFFMVLRERELALHQGSGEELLAAGTGTYTLRWLLLRFGWLVWITTLVVCLLLAWGGSRSDIVQLFVLLNQPISVGELRLRLLGVVYALLILAITHAAARLWRSALRKRIFAHSGLEPSLQESITSISIYLLWGVGILAGMNALGFSATYLTVVFGALSIGLGFGLQNIFNNFISGLILLFERPIKVGDAVEINGIWGTVTKINVRSTVVQTWDNASLIIPNSEFISTQVTNWTFKDTTLRRHIDVGVAYGSDIHLVRDTLIEIARAHPLVLKRPAPSVLFTDFGDSALMFSLRFWTGINVYLTVETDLRFEIDRLFRERQVEIPFPQQDLHVRTVAPPSVAQPSEPEPPEPPDPPIAADE